MKTIDKKPIYVRVDSDIKDEAEKLFDELGMNMTTAITLFLKQSIRDKELPFQPSADNKESIQARKDVEEGNVETFDSVEDWWTSVNES